MTKSPRSKDGLRLTGPQTASVKQTYNAPAGSLFNSANTLSLNRVPDVVAKIAYEKAGIIKPCVPVITAEEDPVVLRVLDSIARGKGTYLSRLGMDFEFRLAGRDRSGVAVHLSSIGRTVPLPLLGDYQASNAAMACEAAMELRKGGLRITEDSMAEGLSNVVWPGRLEVVQERPLVIFDVSHTPEGAKVAVEELLKIRQGKTTVVLGVLNDKDLDGIASEFGRVSDSVIATTPRTKRPAAQG